MTGAWQFVGLTLKPPPHEATHWTARAMAKTVGLAVSTVQKIWKRHGLVPHCWRRFTLSNDPAFAKKLHDVVGLYVPPPTHAVVLSIDEESQIQAALPWPICGRPLTRKAVEQHLNRIACDHMPALLMNHLIQTARSEGLKSLDGIILAENQKMQQLCREFGFSIRPHEADAGLVTARLTPALS